MCGICGISSHKEDISNLNFIIDSISSMKGRGTDSYGLSLETGTALQPNIWRARGLGIIPVKEVKDRIAKRKMVAALAIGHTRMATVGEANIPNAHPFVNEDFEIALAHNGHISEYAEERKKLEAKGHKFSSEVDSEVLLHRFEYGWQKEGNKELTIPALRKASMYAFAGLIGSINVVMTLPGGYLIAYSEGSVCYIEKDGTIMVASTPITEYGDWAKWSGLPSGHWMLLKDGKILKKERIVKLPWDNRSSYSEYDDYCATPNNDRFKADRNSFLGDSELAIKNSYNYGFSRAFSPTNMSAQIPPKALGELKKTRERLKLCVFCLGSCEDPEHKNKLRGIYCALCEESFCNLHHGWHKHYSIEGATTKSEKRDKSKQVECPGDLKEKPHHVWQFKTIQCLLCQKDFCNGHMWDHKCVTGVRRVFTRDRNASSPHEQRISDICPVGYHYSKNTACYCQKCRNWYCQAHVYEKFHVCDGVQRPNALPKGTVLVTLGASPKESCNTCSAMVNPLLQCPVCNRIYCEKHYDDLESHVKQHRFVFLPDRTPPDAPNERVDPITAIVPVRKEEEIKKLPSLPLSPVSRYVR